MITLTIDGTTVQVPKGTTLLAAARQCGIRIPTLCYLENVQAIGACRLCVVEVEGAKTLLAACVTPAAEGMRVQTHSPRAREARRTVAALLLSDHEGECQVCERSEDCDFQKLMSELGVREVCYRGAKSRKVADASTPALARDSSKCILCRRCVTVCAGVQGVGALAPQFRGFKTLIGPAFTSTLDDVACVQCGQCAAVCPVGAIVEKDDTARVWAALDDPAQHVVVQTAPAIRAALGECFGYPPGTRVTGKMVSALRRLGFDAVFDTNFAADLTIMEEGSELLGRLRAALQDRTPAVLPMFTSCSPGWIKFMEYYYPDLLPNLSTCKSPQQMFGAVAKTYYARRLDRRPETITVVSVMPCTAKKFEAQRPEMNSSGVRDVDVVLTTRELARMIRQAGIDFRDLPDGQMDAPLGLSTGAADIFANTGGVMEAALRTAYELVTGRPLPGDNLHVTPIAGLQGVKEASLTVTGAKPEWAFLEGQTVRVAVAHGLSNARGLVERVRAGQETFHFIEVMTCPGGCIGGGGQPRFTDDAVRLARIRAIYSEDEEKSLRTSHSNPQVQQLYREFLEQPLSHTSHRLLHTRYQSRVRV